MMPEPCLNFNGVMTYQLGQIPKKLLRPDLNFRAYFGLQSSQFEMLKILF
jgi:hypothetical protein